MAAHNRIDDIEREARKNNPEDFSKTCIDCNESKLLTEYYPHSSHWDGRQNRCRTCDAAESKRRNGRPGTGKNWCKTCAGLPWRRPEDGLCECGEAYEDEDLTECRRQATASVFIEFRGIIC